MKPLITLLFLFFIYTLHAQDLLCDDRKAISEKLEMIRETDQGIRSRLIKEMATKDPQAMKKIALEMKAGDKQNQLVVGSLLDRCGWPKGLSAAENNTIFLVIDHADTAFMIRYFPLLKSQADQGKVARRDLATLQDRMLLRSGKKQFFGTQTLKEGNIVTIWPVDDPQGLDARRKEMGLIPMGAYMALLKKTYQSEVIWDQDLSVDAAQEKMRKKN